MKEEGSRPQSTRRRNTSERRPRVACVLGPVCVVSSPIGIELLIAIIIDDHRRQIAASDINFSCSCCSKGRAGVRSRPRQGVARGWISRFDRLASPNSGLLCSFVSNPAGTGSDTHTLPRTRTGSPLPLLAPSAPTHIDRSWPASEAFDLHAHHTKTDRILPPSIKSIQPGQDRGRHGSAAAATWAAAAAGGGAPDGRGRRGYERFVFI